MSSSNGQGAIGEVGPPAAAESGRLGPTSDGAFPGRCCADPSVEFVGQLGYGSAGGCVSPSQLRCLRCGAIGFARCKATRESRCPSCARQYRGQVAMVVRDGLEQIGDGMGLFLTVTAPGDRIHGWDNYGVPCRCTPEGGVDLAQFNASFTVRLNRVIEAIKRGEASARTRPRLVRRGSGKVLERLRQVVPLEYVGCREVQDGSRRSDGVGRHALHAHLIMFRSDGKPLQLNKKLLRDLLIEHGFGHAMKLDRIGGIQHGRKARSVERVAWYVAKYVSKAVDCRERVPWRGADGVQRLGGCYRAWSASRGWGQTMAGVREEQRKFREDGPGVPGAGGDRERSDPSPAPGSGPLDSFRKCYAINWPLINKYPKLKPLRKFLEHPPAPQKVKRSGMRDPGPLDVGMF